jgi:iron complex outermembrane receptor protein
MQGQTLQVSGTVLDAADGQPVAGATVTAAGGAGTFSDADGKFTLRAATGEALTVRRFGYVTAVVEAAASLEIRLTLGDALLDAVVIVGSRNPNRSALNTPVPVDIIPLRTQQRTLPQNDLNQMLTYLAPSFQSNRQSSSDGTEHIDPASLRGLGPDQTLVLINGKRRHTTSLLNNQGTFGNGTVGTDLNTIPVSAIERIEVLRDGASAQYGSDAIAGVINVILKKAPDGLSLSATGGITQAGDGELTRLQGNYGLALGKQGGSLNLSLDAYLRGRTTRTQHHDLIIFDQSALGNYFAYAFANDEAISRAYDDSVLTALGLTRDDFDFQVGDAKIQNLNAFYNLSLPFSQGKGEVYAFGGYNVRRGEGYGFRRLPSDYAKMVFSIFPNGFQPNTGSDIQDISTAAGVRYQAGGWLLDLSNTLGRNSFDYSVNNTVNASLQGQSPTTFEAGGHSFTQNTVNLDLSRYEKNVLSGLSLALGGEFRYENYVITAGEEASWRNYGLVTLPDGTVEDQLGLAGGAQSFPGFSPANAIDTGRTSVSLYADTELDLTPAWSIGAAGRFENYSDFGSTFNYKVVSKYSFNEKLVLRAGVSSGFRAPSLHQQYFSYVSTTILSDGRLGQSGFFRNGSALAQSLGIPELKQETSVNASAGFTFKPSDVFNLSLDAYRIRVNDRIVLTGLFGYDPFGGPVPELQALFLPFGADGGRFFTNAINTTTLGLDLVAAYRLYFGESRLEITLLGNLNQTTVDDQFNIPPVLEGQEDIYFSPAERGLIEGVNPRQKVTLTLNYTTGKFTAVLSNVYFGKVYRNGFPFGVEQTFAGKVVTDLSLGYELVPGLQVILGANNLLNVYPDVQAYENSYFGVFKYAPVQMGMNGAFYFARLNLSLGNK